MSNILVILHAFLGSRFFFPKRGRNNISSEKELNTQLGEKARRFYINIAWLDTGFVAGNLRDLQKMKLCDGQ